MNKKVVYKITLSGLLLALGWLLPLITGNIPSFGKMLLPMHIPVLIGGFILGPIYGLILGLIIPLTRCFIFGIPLLYPSAIAMALELGTYGLISGLMFKIFSKKMKLFLSIILSLIISLISGRIIYGVVKYFLCLFIGTNFTFDIFIADILINSWPGIIIQSILIPSLVLTLYKIRKVPKK